VRRVHRGGYQNIVRNVSDTTVVCVSRTGRRRPYYTIRVHRLYTNARRRRTWPIIDIFNGILTNRNDRREMRTFANNRLWVRTRDVTNERYLNRFSVGKIGLAAGYAGKIRPGQMNYRDTNGRCWYVWCNRCACDVVIVSRVAFYTYARGGNERIHRARS